jgi:hypothetical protein
MKVPLVTGATSNASDTLTLSATSFRRGQHIYMIDHVQFDANAVPSALVLRDPYGQYRVISDPVRIHFCIGRMTKLNF